MSRSSLVSLFSIALLAFGLQGSAQAAGPEQSVSAPVVHENLAIYFVRGKSEAGPAPLTLQEALAKKAVVVHETGSVEELFVENKGDEEIYIQSGDIVKGGQQDRVLTVSLVLPKKSGKISIASFCVEQGRWTKRGQENVRQFESADAAVPSRAAKMAMKAPDEALAAELSERRRMATAEAESRRSAAGGGGLGASGGAGGSGGRGEVADSYATGSRSLSRQGAVWDSVSETQSNLSRNLAAPVESAQSRSSLQLALENKNLKKALEDYIAAFKAAGEADDQIVGYAFAINGKLNSADVYPSNALFKKLWPKLLNASVTEAIGEKDKAKNDAAPSVEDVSGFLETAARGKPTRKALTAGISLETRDAEKALYFETTRASGWVHKNYLAK